MSSTPQHSPIAVAGMHRSGTSMVTRALHDSGLHLIGRDADTLIRAAEDNPEGFWENQAIVACNDDLLEATGGTWDHPPELPPQGADDPRVADIVEAARLAIAGLSEHEHWGFKDPRLCLTMPFWLDLIPDLRVIVCVRHPLEVALSLKRRNQNSYALGLALWERYYATALATVPADRRLVSHYDSFFSDPVGELGRVCEFAGLPPAAVSVRDDLRHHTIDVSLIDAGVSPTVISLYAELCREAGVTLRPDAPADEGRVRRLILDGAVAARHAEQRLAAVERLEERERELRAQYSANEEALRARVRDLEQQLSHTRAVAIRRLDEMARQVKVVHHEVTPGPVRRFTRRSLRVSARVVRRASVQGKQSAVPMARKVLARLPASTQRSLRGLRGGDADTAVVSGDARRGTGPQLAAAARAQARSAFERLPPDAERRLTLTWRRVRRARTAPVPTAKRAIQKLPAPAQAATTQLWNKSSGLRLRGSRLITRSRAAARQRPKHKGAPFHEWKDEYQELVRSSIPTGSPWLMIAPGSPTEAGDAISPRASRFPGIPNAAGRDDDLASIAHLEALRSAGNRFLVVPEGSRPWFQRHAEFRHHVVGTYQCVRDESGAGAVFDLEVAAGVAGGSLHHEVERLSPEAEPSPAVLLWTDLDATRDLADLTTFAPPDGPVLPYVDSSIEIVVRDELRDLDEARRVATLGVITITDGPSGIQVLDVEPVTTSGDAPAPKILIRSHASAGDEGWARSLAQRVAQAGAILELGPSRERPNVATDEYHVMIVLEPGVLPLPGAIEAATSLARSHPDSAITGKVLRADGRIDSAGGTVFFDRSVALIGEGGDQTRAAWHDYRRPVCWAPGFVAASTELWSAVTGPSGTPERTLLREWCAQVWEQGGSVVYEPEIAAVRVSGHGGEPSDPLPDSRWQRVLDLRPRRPEHLSDGEWRYLLAHDDVEACRG